MTRVARTMHALAACSAFPPVLAVAAATAGCPSTAATTGYTPITGIVIRSSALVAGYGCGTGPNQVYAYAALVASASGAKPTVPILGSVFTCFTDGVFENLNPSDSGSLDFTVSIFAYDKASLPGDLTCALNGQVANAACPSLALFGPNSPDTRSARWTTTCSATQQQGIPVLAVCAPLQPNDTGADAALQPGTQDATPPDAPSADTGDDGAAEVGIDASLDGGDARD